MTTEKIQGGCWAKGRKVERGIQIARNTRWKRDLNSKHRLMIELHGYNTVVTGFDWAWFENLGRLVRVGVCVEQCLTSLAGLITGSVRVPLNSLQSPAVWSFLWSEQQRSNRMLSGCNVITINRYHGYLPSYHLKCFGAITRECKLWDK